MLHLACEENTKVRECASSCLRRETHLNHVEQVDVDEAAGDEGGLGPAGDAVPAPDALHHGLADPEGERGLLEGDVKEAGDGAAVEDDAVGLEGASGGTHGECLVH